MKTKRLSNGLRIMLLSTLCLVLSLNLMAQDATKITGGVTDPQGNTFPGVTVLEKGTGNGTITDVQGVYNISVPSDAILVFSFIGMTSQELGVQGQTSINVILQEDIIGLEELVVVGYGTQRKADLTGAVSTVSGDQLLKGATANLTSSLAGKISGVTAMSRTGTPGNEDVDFLIRGKSTFSDANNAPLVLVDGIERSMSRINPEDVESVTVLKDAASASIYGVKGANGVILVTTKRGKAGQAEVSYSAKFGSQTPQFLPDRMDSYEYATHLNEANFNLAERDGGEYTPVYTAEQVESFRNGTGTNTNWYDENANSSAPIQIHNLTVSDGNEKIAYRTSLEYLDQERVKEQNHPTSMNYFNILQ
jgi:TonB-linked SusC/RagA family outer membrane protein